MNRSVGFWRLEFAIQNMEWGLPFLFINGTGAFTFGILCLQLLVWRGKFRYDRNL